jgi:gliding motility-associated-like protein
MLHSLVRRPGVAFRENRISFFPRFLQRNWQRSLAVVIAVVATPAFTLAQSNPGTILGSQCITAGGTPTAFTSIRNADLTGGLTISWEKSVDFAFTVPIPIGGATGQTYAEGAVLVTTYYRRVISSTPVSYSNIITVTVAGAVANPTFTPQVPPFPIICQQTTSFPVNYTTTGTPDRYSIFWDAAAVAAGFVDAVDIVLGATPGNITVNVPAGAAASVYNGTLIAVNTGNGCTVSNASSVLVNPLPVITGTLSACINATTALNGSGTAAAVNPWVSSNPAVATVDNTGVVTGVSSGTSIITYTNNSGCQQTATVTINALPAITGTLNTCINATTALSGSGTVAAVNPWISSNTAIATVDNTGLVTGVSAGTSIITYTNNNGCQQTVTVTVNPPPTATITPGGATTFCAGGSVNLTAPLSSSYLWSTGATTQSINITGSGSNTVTITDVNGCSATSSATTVTVNALPTATITPGGATTFCAGGSVNLTAPLSSSYLWSTGAATQSINITSSGSNTVTITDVNGCSATSSATTVTVNALPTATITPGGATTFCAGGSVNLTAPLSSTYLWSTGATTQSINITGSGSNTVTITDVNGCSATSSATNVTVNTLPTATITPGGATTFCAGGSVNLTAPLSSSYLWSTGAATQSINITGSGSNTVTITDVNGCSATSSATNVTVNTLPTATITPGGATTFCAGGSVNLTAPLSSSYLWSTGATTQSINITVSGSNTVTITDVNGCSATSSATIVAVNPLPTVSITAAGPVAFCSGGAVTLTSSSGSSYLWDNGQTTQSVNVNNTGARTVTMTDANGCSATSPVTSVTVNPLPTVSITAGGPVTFCSGGSVTLNSTAGSSYLWNSGETTQSISVNNTATKTVTMTDGNGCSGTSSVTSVTVNPLPVVNAITGSNAVCTGSTITLANTTPGGIWSSSVSTIAVIGSSGVLTAVSAGTTNVFYTVTDANNCTASVSSSKTVNPLPFMTIGNPAAVCEPAAVDITQPFITTGSDPAADLSYWTNAAATSLFITPNAASNSGTYYIKGTLPATGCSNIRSVIVTVNSLPSFSINNPAAVCEPATVDITTAGITNGTASALTLSYWRNQTATTGLATPAALTVSGTYYIKGVAVTGCAVVLPVSVTVNPLPNGSLQIPPVSFICDGTPLTLTASDAFAYQWFNNQQPIGGAVAAVYTPSVAGNYSVQFSSAAGCRKNSDSTIMLTLFVKPVISFNAGGRCTTSPVNFTNNSLFANSGTINWLWNFDDGSSSNNISVSHSYRQAGSYNVLLTANNVSCPAFTDSATTALNIEAPADAVRYDTVFAVNGKPFVLSAREIGSTYQWRPSSGLGSAVVRTPTAILTTDASYTVSITSSAACVTTDTVFVKLKNDGEIYVAQGFTPNGDGLNDRAYPILVGVKQLVYFKIFNRWGNLLFQTNDETPQNGWDGKYQGRMQQAGTYTWIAEVIDGNGKVIQKKGSLLLIN